MLSNYKNNKLILISTILFTLFVINVIAGKIILIFDVKQFSVIGDVGEFLILFVTVIFFMFAVLLEEKRSDVKENRE